MNDTFYKVILEAMITDTEASLRMLGELDGNESAYTEYVVPVKSSLRRAVKDAKLAMKGFEDES